MTEVELRRLRRVELVEMLLEQRKENESLKSRVEELEKQLASREIKIAAAGSIAQAAMELNEVFAAAQAAADQYLENIKLLAEGKTAEINQKEQPEQEELPVSPGGSGKINEKRTRKRGNSNSRGIGERAKKNKVR